jgi:hypothetical protein
MEVGKIGAVKQDWALSSTVPWWDPEIKRKLKAKKKKVSRFLSLMANFFFHQMKNRQRCSYEVSRLVMYKNRA